MRVIAGKFRGRKLTGPRDDRFRPTLDQVKESIFNVLGDDITGSRVLDLFCGSGSLGIEAISRGAKHATLVDRDKRVLDIANQNAINLDIQAEVDICLKDVFKFIQQFDGRTYDIILADPPYDKMYGSRLYELIIRYEILKSGGIFTLERYKKDMPISEGFRLAKKLEFGQTEVDFYIRED